MTTKKDLLLKNVDHILLVNKDYEIVYNSRFDPAIGNKPDAKEYKNFFEMYPSLGRNNSSIVKTMSTGTSIFRDAQEFVDINGNVYVTQNVTIGENGSIAVGSDVWTDKDNHAAVPQTSSTTLSCFNGCFSRN